MQYDKEAYTAHLQSDYWKEVKRLLWQKQNGKCAICHKSMWHQLTHGHHNSYRVFGHEKDDLDSVELVHASCHEDLHFKPLSWAELARRIAKL